MAYAARSVRRKKKQSGVSEQMKSQTLHKAFTVYRQCDYCFEAVKESDGAVGEFEHEFFCSLECKKRSIVERNNEASDNL